MVFLPNYGITLQIYGGKVNDIQQGTSVRVPKLLIIEHAASKTQFKLNKIQEKYRLKDGSVGVINPPAINLQ